MKFNIFNLFIAFLGIYITSGDKIPDIVLFEVCFYHTEVRIPHPVQCQLFYDCSVFYRKIPVYYEPFLVECPYPQLFNEVTSECDDYRRVDCKDRVESRLKCDYISSRCHFDTGVCVKETTEKRSCDDDLFKLFSSKDRNIKRKNVHNVTESPPTQQRLIITANAVCQI